MIACAGPLPIVSVAGGALELAAPADGDGTTVLVGDDRGDTVALTCRLAGAASRTSVGDGAGRAPGHGPTVRIGGSSARAQPGSGVVGVGEVGGGRRHPAVAVAGQPSALPRRDAHRLLAGDAGEAGDGAHRPLVGRRQAAPQAQLVAAVVAHLVGVETQQHDAG